MVKKILVQGKYHLAATPHPDIPRHALGLIEVSFPILKRLNEDDLAYLHENYGADADKYETTYTRMYKHFSQNPNKTIELIIEKNSKASLTKIQSHTADEVLKSFELEKLPQDPYSRAAGILQPPIVIHQASQKEPLTFIKFTTEELKPLYEAHIHYLRTQFGFDAKNYITLYIQMYEALTDPILSQRYQKDGPNFTGTFCNPDRTIDFIIPYNKPHNRVELAERLINATGPRIIHLTNKHVQTVPFEPESKNYFSAIAGGCGGNGSRKQIQVAELMNYLVGTLELLISLIINLGDNWYNNIIDSPIHDDFNKLFYLIFYTNNLRNLSRLKFHGSLGNHCEGYDRFENLKQRFSALVPSSFKHPFGRAASKNILMQCYLTHMHNFTLNINNGLRYTRTIDDKNPQHVRMDLSECAAFDIPYYFTSRILLDTFQLLYINTNDFPRYLMAYLKHVTKIELLTYDELQKNQFYFMWKAYSYGEFKELVQLAIQHIPIYELKGREDGKYYNAEEDMIRLDLIIQLPGFLETPEFFQKAHLILTNTIKHLRYIPGIPEPTVDRFSQNILLARIYKVMGWHFKLIVCAHDHMIAFINDSGLFEASFNETWDGVNRGRINPDRPDNISHYPFTQVTSAGTGGSLHDIAVYTQIRNCYFTKSHGVSVLTFNKETRTIDVHLITTLTSHIIDGKEVKRPGLHMRFVAGASSPIQDVSTNDAIVDRINIKRPKHYIKPLPTLFHKHPINNLSQLRERLIYFIHYATDILNAYENDESYLAKIEHDNNSFPLFKAAVIDNKVNSVIKTRKQISVLDAKERLTEADKLITWIKQETNLNTKSFENLLPTFKKKNLNKDMFDYRMNILKEFIDKLACVPSDIENFIKLETLRTLVTITGKEYQLFLNEKLSASSNFYLTNATHTRTEAYLVNESINFVNKHKVDSYEQTLIELLRMIEPLKKIDGKHSFYESLNYKLSHSKILGYKNINQLYHEARITQMQKSTKPSAPKR